MNPSCSQLARMAGVRPDEASRYLSGAPKRPSIRALVRLNLAMDRWNADGPTGRVYRLLAQGERLDLFRDFQRTGDSRLSSTIARLRDKLEALPEFANCPRWSVVVTEKHFHGACEYYIHPAHLAAVAPILARWADAANEQEKAK